MLLETHMLWIMMYVIFRRQCKLVDVTSHNYCMKSLSMLPTIEKWHIPKACNPWLMMLDFSQCKYYLVDETLSPLLLYLMDTITVFDFNIHYLTTRFKVLHKRPFYNHSRSHIFHTLKTKRLLYPYPRNHIFIFRQASSRRHKSTKTRHHILYLNTYY